MIYEYYHRFEWETWKDKELAKEINTTTKKNIVEGINTTLNNVNDGMIWLSKFQTNIQEQTSLAFLNFDRTDFQSSKVAIQLVQLQKDVLKLLAGLPVDIEETYHIIHNLQSDKDSFNPTSNFAKMLNDCEERFKEYYDGCSNTDDD